MPRQQGVMSAYQLTNHDHSSALQGGNINPMADVGIGMPPSGTDRLQVFLEAGGAIIEAMAGAGNIPAITLDEAGINRGYWWYDPTAHELVLEALSEDANIKLTPHGTGKVEFGVHVVKGAEALTGYIIINDAAGNPRKVGIIS